MGESFHYGGFRSTTTHKFRMNSLPSYWHLLSLGELKVQLYVMRRTFGFKKGSDRISKSQLENGIVKEGYRRGPRSGDWA